MVAERKYINIEDKPDLAVVASEVQESKIPVVLRRGGADVAVIRPLESRNPGEPGELTDEEIEAFRATAGGWVGIVDVDEFLKNNRESREFSSRPPVDL